MCLKALSKLTLSRMGFFKPWYVHRWINNDQMDGLFVLLWFLLNGDDNNSWSEIDVLSSVTQVDKWFHKASLCSTEKRWRVIWVWKNSTYIAMSPICVGIFFDGTGNYFCRVRNIRYIQLRIQIRNIHSYSSDVCNIEFPSGIDT